MLNRTERRKMQKDIYKQTVGCGKRSDRKTASINYVTNQDAREFSILTKKPGFIPED